MTKTKTKKPNEPELKSTSFTMPVELWKTAQHRCVEERLRFKQLLFRALEQYLKQPKGGH